MARPLRYEAAGAVYHVMARGDGGKTVFEDDKDRYGWVDLMERACEQLRLAGACVGADGKPFPCAGGDAGAESGGGDEMDARGLLAGLEPAAAAARACVSGPIQGGGGEWRGAGRELFQDRGGLHPSQSGEFRLGGRETGKRLRSWRWSSFPAYAGGKKPDWLETDRVLRAFRLSEDHRGGRAYAGYLEARAKDAKGAVTDASLKELRRGWCLGEKSFAEKVLAALAGGARPKRRKGSVAGAAARAHDEAEAERLALAALRALDAPDRGVAVVRQRQVAGGKGGGGGADPETNRSEKPLGGGTSRDGP